MPGEGGNVQQHHLEFGQAARLARQQAGLTQEQVAEALGVGQSAVSQWEGGWALPNREHLEALTRVLDLGAEDLLQRAVEAERRRRQEET